METTLPVLLSQVIPVHVVQLLEPPQLDKLWFGSCSHDLNHKRDALSCGWISTTEWEGVVVVAHRRIRYRSVSECQKQWKGMGCPMRVK